MGFLNIPGLGRVHYHEYGSGERLLFAFHGYGMTGKQFDVLRQSFLPQYRIISFDHFFHGKSELHGYGEKEILAGIGPDQPGKYLEAWFEAHQRQRFSLLAYSIGANYALILLSNYAELVDELFLMAPDGLIRHQGFHFLTGQPIGKWLFRKFTYSNWIMPAFLKGLRAMRLIDAALFKTAYTETDTPEKRLDVYRTLHFLKTLRPDIQRVAALINQYQIRCVLVFGKHDQLFPRRNASRLAALLTRKEIWVVPLGHWLVTPQLDDYLISSPDGYLET